MPSGTWYIISREVQNSYPQYPQMMPKIHPKNTPEDFLFSPPPRKDFQSLKLCSSQIHVEVARRYLPKQTKHVHGRGR